MNDIMNEKKNKIKTKWYDERNEVKWYISFYFFPGPLEHTLPATPLGQSDQIGAL